MTTKHIFHHLGRALSALLLVAMLLSFSGVALASSGDTTRVSIATGGTQADGDSYIYFPSISADGRYVAFESDASNLVAGDTNNGAIFSSVTVRRTRPLASRLIRVGQRQMAAHTLTSSRPVGVMWLSILLPPTWSAGIRTA
ncbi:hypothetical protein [Candidatus Villigracilis proximus]|uniref:hypothetical protein n=1 Tax=Candidatus Villigracilis proximus TaxID=3140683 RepID=UPI0031E6159A